MKYIRKTGVVLALLACLSVFGAWTTAPDEVRFGDAPTFAPYANETVSYTSRDVTENTTPYNVPKYAATNGLLNACGPVAGAITVGYYDKYYSGLIPNWDSYFPKTGKYRAQDRTYVPALINDLYSRMRTNVDGVGVSENDFKNGLASYVADKGYSLNFRTVVSGGKPNYSAIKAAIDGGKIAILFAKEGRVYEVTNSSNTDTIIPTNIGGAHIIVVYGYKEITYRNTNGAFRTDNYLFAMTGFENMTPHLYNLQENNLLSGYVAEIS